MGLEPLLTRQAERNEKGDVQKRFGDSVCEIHSTVCSERQLDRWGKVVTREARRTHVDAVGGIL